MSTEWIKKKREDWPEGSLERQLKLNYPGCSTAFEAVKKIKSQKNETATQAPKVNKNILNEIQEIIGDFDIETLDPNVRKRLAEIPLGEYLKECWVKVLEGVKGGKYLKKGNS